MNEFRYSPITIKFFEECHKINEDNVPNVGSSKLEDFIELVNNSDFNLCVTKNDSPIGYVICFQDKEPTNSYMEKINHKNFREINKRLNNYLYIDRIAINSDYRKNKLATELYSKVVDFAKNSSIDNLTAEINLLPSVNTASFKFHQSFGFVEIDKVKYNYDYEVSLQKKTI
jgi:predicted GNAT superfamily acetyltransferase|tara:strand:+ start:1212 stop:1727 length:516 start_codon:yes stop_codon:yes gene_type:complete